MPNALKSFCLYVIFEYDVTLFLLFMDTISSVFLPLVALVLEGVILLIEQLGVQHIHRAGEHAFNPLVIHQLESVLLLQVLVVMHALRSVPDRGWEQGVHCQSVLMQKYSNAFSTIRGMMEANNGQESSRQGLEFT